MKIAVDCRTFTRTSTGISNYLLNSINALINYNNDIELYLIAQTCFKQDVAHRIILSDRIHYIIIKSLYSEISPLFFFYLKLPFIVNKLRVNFFWSPTPSIPYGLKKNIFTIITIHDVINIEYKETISIRNRISAVLSYKRSILSANYIWAVSEYTKTKMSNYFPNRRSKNVFVGSSIDRNLYKPISLSAFEIENIKKKYTIEDDFILFVGSIESRKNLLFLLKIIEELYPRIKIQLVIVGAAGWKNSEIYKYINGKTFPKESTTFLGFVPNEDLVLLYNMAKCFVSTSKNEGFGMPQLEALCCNCPVVTAHNSAMIEIVTGRGITVKGWDIDDWCESIQQAIKSPKKDIIIPRKFDWDYVISNLISYLKENHSLL